MGYRSEVKSVIYGPKGKIDAFIAHTTLIEPSIAWTEFKGSLTRHSSIVTHYEKVDDSYQPIETEVDIIFLQGDSWKWYDNYPDVIAWHALLQSAEELFELEYEFHRVGEEPGDIVNESSTNAHGFLQVTTPTIEIDFNDSNTIPLGIPGQAETPQTQETAS